MSLPRTSRHADEFARLLDAGAVTDDPTTGPMLAVASALQAVPAAGSPRPEFRDALRQRLVAVATVQGVGTDDAGPVERVRAAGRTWRVQRRLTALAAGAAVVTGVTGVGLGASRSLPGDPFYGVKRATESVQLATTFGTEARGKRHLEFARTRLREVKALAGRSDALAPTGGGHLTAAGAAGGNVGAIVRTLHDMDVETRSGANDLLAAYRDSASNEPLRTLHTFSTTQYTRLRDLLTTLPAPAQPEARGSLALLTYVATVTSSPAAPTVGSTNRPVGSVPTPTGSPAPAPRPTASVTATTPVPVSPSTTGGLPHPAGPTSPAVQPVQLPTANPTPSVPLPILTIPALPTSLEQPSPLPTLPVLPTLPALPALPGVGG